ncbi:hypothetical protein BDY17DRAFT_319685 [Neohortaea acidophila]|uniref:DUF7962 domain-containing protein n=1 Tax=Neohortaea acidophila TaxID=245834 RepID=A0A6A6Q4X4_9PEZI|nr:uncharacterized protein BDY17DRAFT_319685 [Neohortaea acidophila]KAF2487121.1 hypothetical protein BDY17DRAFT_319685 [Neohortaea acidophila]
MASSPKPEIITFDYQYAPNAQRARNLLNLTGLKYSICEQPFVQPRPIVQNLGITYRRVPVNAIGKDVYPDNRTFLDAILTIFADEKGVKELVRSKHDEGYEAFGYRMFWNLLEILPDTVYNETMVKDRADLYSMLSKHDYREVRPAAIQAFKQFLDIIEHDFLADVDSNGPWIAGAKPGVADLQAAWIPKFTLETIDYANGASAGKEGEGITPEHYPRVFKWLKLFPNHVPENEATKVSGEEASERILKAPYAAKDIGVDETGDSTGFKKGDKVQIATTDDTTPGNMAQYGTLVGLNRKEQVIQLDNGLRLHFPRIGYSLKKA